MPGKNMVKFRENCLVPECPLELVKISSISPNGSVNYVLHLNGTQELRFRQAHCLVGKNITYVIPKYFCDKDGLFKIQLPTASDIVVKDINCSLVPVTIIEAVDKCAFYLIIPVTEDLLSECDLVLEFVKLKLALVPSDTCHKHIPRKVDWKWILSVTTATNPPKVCHKYKCCNKPCKPAHAYTDGDKGKPCKPAHACAHDHKDKPCKPAHACAHEHKYGLGDKPTKFEPVECDRLPGTGSTVLLSMYNTLGDYNDLSRYREERHYCHPVPGPAKSCGVKAKELSQCPEVWYQKYPQFVCH